MVPRMRTIDKAYEYVLGNDPDTQLSKNAFKKLVLSGEIASVNVGRKKLVNLDLVDRYLSCGVEQSEPTPTTPTTVIPENTRLILELVKEA